MSREKFIEAIQKIPDDMKKNLKEFFDGGGKLLDAEENQDEYYDEFEHRW